MKTKLQNLLAVYQLQTANGIVLMANDGSWEQDPDGNWHKIPANYGNSSGGNSGGSNSGGGCDCCDVCCCTALGGSCCCDCLTCF